MELTNLYIGGDLVKRAGAADTLGPFCTQLDGTNRVLLRFWLGTVALMFGQILLLLAVQANSHHVAEEKLNAPLPSKSNDKLFEMGETKMENPVGANRRSRRPDRSDRSKEWI